MTELVLLVRESHVSVVSGGAGGVGVGGDARWGSTREHAGRHDGAIGSRAGPQVVGNLWRREVCHYSPINFISSGKVIENTYCFTKHFCLDPLYQSFVPNITLYSDVAKPISIFHNGPRLCRHTLKWT